MKKLKRQKRRLSLKQKGCFFFCVLIILVVAILLFLNLVVNPVIIETSASKIRALSQKCIEYTAYQVINSDNIYDSLVRISRNEQGEIVSIGTNSASINMLAREFAQKAQKNLDTLGEGGINIPIGSFTGMPIFTGRGPTINIKMLPIGSIRCSFKSDFQAAGINQTNHKIYLIVTSDVNIILPTASQKVTTTTEIMISECIILGKVPDVYVGSNDMNYLDLIP